MRSHAQIIKSVGASALVRALDAHGTKLHQSTPQRWADRNSIPAQYWATLAELQIATLEELAAAVDSRSQSEAA